MSETKLDDKLNKREKYKARLRPFDYFKEFDTLDFDSLGEGDRFYLQDFGIFTTDFLEDEFTMRLRVPAGRLSNEQFSYIAEVVKEYDLTMIITARAGIQLHDIESDNVKEIWKKLNSKGLTTWQSFGDNIRNIVSNVYDGRGKYNQIEVYDIVMQMQEFIVQNPRYVGMLPRRVSVAVSGNSASISSFFANDLYFALAKKDGVFGFNVYLGGKNTEVAKCADIFLLKEEVFDFFKAFVEAFYLHGSRYSRSKTRLFFMIQEIGMKGLRDFIEPWFKPFTPAGELQLKKVKFSLNERLKDGTYSFCYQTDFARLDADELLEISRVAIENDSEIRIGIDQNIYLFGLKEPIAPIESKAKSASIVSCAGNLCPYAVWSIKDETKYLPLDDINRLGITIGFSGCAKGCGRHLHTDIGLIGLKTNNFGDTDGGARIFVGAVHTTGSTIGRLLFSMVPFVHLKETISIIISIFELSGFDDFEEFSHKVLSNYHEEFLSMWVLASFETKRVVKLEQLDSPLSFEASKELLAKTFAEVEVSEPIDENFKKAISAMVKKEWTIEGEDPIYKPRLNRANYR